MLLHIHRLAFSNLTGLIQSNARLNDDYIFLRALLTDMLAFGSRDYRKPRKRNMTRADTGISYAPEPTALAPAPINPDWIEGGNPSASAALLAQSADGATSAFIWECSPGKFTWRYSNDETVHFLDGSVIISCDGMPPRRFRRGDTIHFPKGSQATWVIEKRIRKVAFCRSVLPEPLPRLERLLRRVLRWLRARRSGEPAAAHASLLQS